MQHLFTLATATALLLSLGYGDTGTSATLVDSAGAKSSIGNSASAIRRWWNRHGFGSKVALNSRSDNTHRR